MRDSTIHHPALLAHAGRFVREAKRIGANARSAGLFDLPIEANGLNGHTLREAEAIRALRMLGEAFGLHGDALVEWHKLIVSGDEPRVDGGLVRTHRAALPDLLLRAHTLALFQDREGHGGEYLRVWRRTKPLRRLLDDLSAASACLPLAKRVHELACLPAVDGHALLRVCRSRRLYDQLLVHAPHLVWFMPGVHALAGAGVPLTGMRDMRDVLRSEGLTNAGWRWLAVNAPYRLYESMNNGPSLQIMLANVFGAIGPHFAPCDFFCGSVWEPALELQVAGWQPSDIAQVIHAAWRHFDAIEAVDDRDHFMHSTFRLVMEWLVDFGWAPDVNQRRAGWVALERAWRVSIGADRGPLVRWSVPIASVEHRGLVAYAIDNSHWLWSEGQALSNCVADLLDEVSIGDLLVFVVRDESDKSIAMFSFKVALGPHLWVADQCKGRFNREVGEGRVSELMENVLNRVRALDP
ncbi:hypothetical protein GHT07_09095 [Caenimonas koreensis DSM 17982]|uniref:PcfJ-like protein n=1 Tax=Caenimonas koreensis DSM 17982 TaxID=1121255 RepID=A0A844B2E0_9BURK|nr:hypothetical protein [Caenimonas koreensis]MRD47432.1 hypothetical protein [Caenimonas koreensis DSM 17982]